ncbi:MAG TPA: tRNA pseudouridine(38-40) synthase TruA, partial [Hyphomonadaceae bacterium]|nr:tRNA pseudouridine(38-40) synthase TruA [Hyphomonadaceae bacterium]
AQALVGTHDFTTFRDSQCQAESPVKSLNAISVTRLGEEVHVRCRALSFLHRQVRSMVGTLVEVGRGKEDVRSVGKVLAAADRAQCGPVAPPDGLHLTRVDY